MADEKLVEMLKRGAVKWTSWRIRHIELDVDLSGANLVAANLAAKNLRLANLAGADLQSAVILQTDFTYANLDEANFSRAHAGWTAFANLDLSMTKGLREVQHIAPSSIGLDTILRSGGKIPPEFLRGCGYDPLIQDILMGDHESKTTAFYQWVAKGHHLFQRCFISYATEDIQFVERLQKALNEKGVDYWYAPRHGEWGNELSTQIDREISLRDRMLLVCSETSLSKDWVIYEIERALNSEKERKCKVIFPIMLDDALTTWKHPFATRIKEVLAADFRGATKGKAFDESLERLLAALQSSGTSKSA